VTRAREPGRAPRSTYHRAEPDADIELTRVERGVPMTERASRFATRDVLNRYHPVLLSAVRTLGR